MTLCIYIAPNEIVIRHSTELTDCNKIIINIHRYYIHKFESFFFQAE